MTQASLSVKRTSYLNARRSTLSPPATRQRPKTAVARRRRHPPDNRGHAGNFNNNDGDNNPLLSHLEREFLFGAGAARGVPPRGAPADEDEVYRAPSLRKTTLGRLLQRSAVSSSSLPTSSADVLPHHGPALSESSSVSSLYRRPLSAGSKGDPRADDHIGRRRKLGRSIRFSNRPSSRGRNAAVLSKARARPSSAAPDGGRRRRERSSLPAAAGKLPSQVDGKHRHPHRSRMNSSAYRDKNIRVGATAAVQSPTKHGGPATCAHERVAGLSEGSAAAATGRPFRQPPINVHQALEATIKAAIGAVSPREQFVNARKTIAEMKSINTRDSTGDILLTTQVSQL